MRYVMFDTTTYYILIILIYAVCGLLLLPLKIELYKLDREKRELKKTEKWLDTRYERLEKREYYLEKEIQKLQNRY